LDRVFDGALVPMLAHFLQGREISDSERQELGLLLGAKKKAAGSRFELSI
jgi:predicted transcriptional regulator